MQILEVLASNHVDRDQTPTKSSQTWIHYRTVTLKGAVRYGSIGKFNCTLYIYGILHCPYLK